jgi:hypothetical protein
MMDEGHDCKKGVGCNQTKDNRESCSIVGELALTFRTSITKTYPRRQTNAFCDQAPQSVDLPSSAANVP